MPIKSDYYKSVWDSVRSRNAELRKSGYVLVRSAGKHMGNRIQVVSPYSSEFAAECLAMGGTWRKRTGTWTFRATQASAVLRLCYRIFGPDKVNTKKLQVHIPSPEPEPNPPVDPACPF